MNRTLFFALALAGFATLVGCRQNAPPTSPAPGTPENPTMTPEMPPAPTAPKPPEKTPMRP